MTRSWRAIVEPMRAFLRLEAASGIVLLVSAAVALALANTGASGVYRTALDTPLAIGFASFRAEVTLAAVVGEGLMAVFFLLVGMEIKRELTVGELRRPRQALLPAIGALGGVLFPAAIYVGSNGAGPARAGWGIPMATDIAFCVGVLTLLRTRVPHALVVFVTALAIFDDIAGILVIALFYGAGVSWAWLALGAAASAALVFMSRSYVRSFAAYALVGAGVWYALHHAGIHATIAGVVVGLCIPARPRTPDEAPPLERFVLRLHPWVAFGVMPVFALANAGVDLRALEPSQLRGPVAVGTAVALVVGKPVGIFTFTWIAVRLRVAATPGGASAVKLLGAAAVAGIGFTVALFIAGLAFPGAPALLDQAKVGILGGSLAAGLLGALILRLTARVNGPDRAAPREVRAHEPAAVT